MSIKFPPNHSEAEVLDIIENVATRLASRFKFGCNDLDDMKQQARLFALEGLKYYIEGMPLENFLWTHVRNRLFNFKRDKYLRPSTKVKKGKNALNYEAKRNLMHPINIDNVVDEGESSMRDYGDKDNELEYKELVQNIRNELPVDLQKIFVRLQSGSKVSKVQKTRVQEEVRKILDKYDY